MTHNLTCIICPLGCSLRIETEEGRVISVEGNTCPRGKAYARTEMTEPVRTITTTVKTPEGYPVPVKTATPIPKDKIMDAMKIINSVQPVLPIAIGDVIIEDVFGSKIVATANMEE